MNGSLAHPLAETLPSCSCASGVSRGICWFSFEASFGASFGTSSGAPSLGASHCSVIRILIGDAFSMGFSVPQNFPGVNRKLSLSPAFPPSTVFHIQDAGSEETHSVSSFAPSFSSGRPRRTTVDATYLEEKFQFSSRRTICYHDLQYF